MSSLIIDLWPFLCRFLVVVAFVCLWMLCSRVWLPGPVVYAGGCCLLVNFCWQQARLYPWLRPFVARTRRFLSLSGGRVVLRYAPGLNGQADPREVLDLAEKTLSDLEATFGRLTLFWHGPLLFRRRVYVYLFPTAESVQDVFGRGVAGTALLHCHAVVVPFEGWRLHESLLHELTHLFAARWNQWAPPLLAEGLATCLQGTRQGDPVDEAAVRVLREDCRLRPLLDGKFFFDLANRSACYILAGSFSGFLIRRFGWDAYKRFYCRQSGDHCFDDRFIKHFGLTLEEAEGQWRSELLN